MPKTDWYFFLEQELPARTIAASVTGMHLSPLFNSIELLSRCIYQAAFKPLDAARILSNVFFRSLESCNDG
jgi:hypothetical protein